MLGVLPGDWELTTENCQPDFSLPSKHAITFW